LAKRYAATTLPSVSSLRALRTFAKRGKASQPFIGFGDPDLGEPGGSDRGKINYAQLMRGFVARPNELKQSFSSLPETADELRGIASALGASNDNIYLSSKATETMVKGTDLAPYRIVAFATHGLMAGEQTGLPEPALVLTPPAKATQADDGLLTASEIAQLKLNAEWVLLSACNTASGDTPNADGLSGLAKAFFYAGSRALLVSHWPVVSDATVTLITRMFEMLANDNTVGRSEALRQSMLSMMNDNTQAHRSHPAFWAPFVVVGEGARDDSKVSPPALENKNSVWDDSSDHNR
jgi:CHAT domain-containing protein